MKKILLSLSILFLSCELYAQEKYSQWPADKPETEFIEESQSKGIRSGNGILPQEISMQDKMRVLITDMMQNASKKLGWQMVELSEYTNNGGLQSGSTPYNLRSPRGIEITFQFVVNKDSLQAWKNYQTNYNNNYSNAVSTTYSTQQDVTNSPLYKRYKDSADHYMNLYINYVNAHQSEGADLYTKDKHPKYYQDKENEFIEKMTNMTQQVQDNSGIDQMENKNELRTFLFRNHTIVQVHFQVNTFVGIAIDQTLGPIESTSSTYPMPPAIVAKLYTIPKKQTNETLVKWKNMLLVLLGNFHTKPNGYGDYDAGFNHNGQGDEHTPKKIKSDKVQNISISISGDKINVEKMAKLIDVEKLNSTIVKH
ncbi:MAG: hypothetical protein JST21_14430 [Bacteroidetes bacterium]|nr:hypothetical protein [Bacteroidota bacterium]